MTAAVEAVMNKLPEGAKVFILLDGDGIPAPLKEKYGDRIVCEADADVNHYPVAASSLLAKVERDRLMVDLDGQYPGYGIKRSKGYGVPQHLRALQRLGPSAIHRMSFSPCAKAQDEHRQVAEQAEAVAPH